MRVKKDVRTNIIEGYLELAEHHLNYAKPLKSAEKGFFINVKLFFKSEVYSRMFAFNPVLYLQCTIEGVLQKRWDELVMVVTATDQ